MSNVVVKGPATEIATLEILSPADLFAPGGTEPVYEAIHKEVSTLLLDATTEQGRKEIASLAYKIAQSKNFLDKVGKTFNADLKEKTKAVDAERKVIWDKLEALQKEMRKPLTEWEEAEEARTNSHKVAMKALESITVFDHTPTYEEICQRQSMFDEFQTRDWEEFKDMAFDLMTEKHSALHHIAVAAEQAERDRVELEALRAAKAAQDAKEAEAFRQKQIDIERVRIEKEAAEKAQRDAAASIAKAQAAEREAKEEAARLINNAENARIAAENAKIAAEAKAKLEADAAVEAEKKRAEAKAKRLSDEAASSRKVRDEMYAGIKGCIEYENGEIVDDLESIVDSIVAAILNGKVKHVKVTY